MSQLSDRIFIILRDLFPQATIKLENYISFNGYRLFFDFFLPQYNILLEVQGKQHFEYVEYFHKGVDGFKDSKKRDQLKVEYCQLNNLVLVVVNYDDVFTKENILNKIIEAQSQ